MSIYLALEFRKPGLVMRMEETKHGGARIYIHAKGQTDEIVIPKELKPHFQEAFDLASKALRVWK